MRSSSRCLLVIGFLLVSTAPAVSHAQGERYHSPFGRMFDENRDGPPALPGLGTRPRQEQVAPAVFRSTQAPATHGVTLVSGEKTASRFDDLEAQVTAERARLNEDKSVEEAAKTAALKHLDVTSELLRVGREQLDRSHDFRTQARKAEQTIGQTMRQLARPAPVLGALAESETVSDLEAHRAKAEQAAQKAQQELSLFMKERENRATRKTEIVRLLAELTDSKTVKADEAATTSTAEKLEKVARDLSVNARKDALLAEQAWFEAMADWFPKQRELLERNAAENDRALQHWQKLVATARQAETQKQAEEARLLAERADPSLRKLADRNSQLANRRSELAPMIEDIRVEAKRVQTLSRELRTEFDNVKARVENGGGTLTTTTGLLLRQHGFDLPSASHHTSRIAFVESEIPKVQLERIDVDADRITRGPEQSGSVFTALEAMEADLLKSRSKLVEELSNDLDSYQTELAKLESNTRVLVTDLTEFSAFISENILWVRSHQPLSLSDFQIAPTDALRAVPASEFAAYLTSLKAEIAQHAGRAVLLAILAFFVIEVRRRSLVGLKLRGEQAASESCTSFRPTIQAFAYTCILALAWPLFIGGTAWCARRMGIAGVSYGFTTAVISCACTLALLETARQMFRNGGLGNAHFGWTQRGVASVRRHLLILEVLAIPIIYLVIRLEQMPDARHIDSGSRVLFSCGMFLLGWFLFVTAWPSREPLRGWLANRPGSWMARLRYVWATAIVGVPIAFAFASAFGYHYTATHLAVRFELSAALMMGLLLVHCLADRALLVAHRRALLAAETLAANAEEPAEEAVTPEKSREAHDQLERLIGGALAVVAVAAVWFIWSDVTPALGILDRVELWSQTTEVWETLEPGGSEISRTVRQPVTLKHLLAAVLLLAGTIMSARNIPGFLQIVAFRHITFDAGARHAITALCRYALTITGFVLAFRAVGIGWSSVQWLVAAMTVGLGFGMQEIFANFVSGLIILFERPVRVGDLVTVSGVTGKITAMRIRATTITDFDRRELIVPNKKFITDDVMNWTLTDAITRVVIPVGVSYDTDVNAARELLLSIATDNALIMKEPAASAVFKGFGDSTLNFELRFFIASREYFVDVQNQVNTAIVEGFRKARIEISFPQRDIHIRTASVAALGDVARKAA